MLKSQSYFGAAGTAYDVDVIRHSVRDRGIIASNYYFSVYKGKITLVSH